MRHMNHVSVNMMLNEWKDVFMCKGKAEMKKWRE